MLLGRRSWGSVWPRACRGVVSGACCVEYTLGIHPVLLIISPVGTALCPFLIRPAKGTYWLVSLHYPFIMLPPLFKYSHLLSGVAEEQTLQGH